MDSESITVKLDRHPDALTLSIVRIGGQQVVVRTADWSDGDAATYVYPDAEVDTTHPSFAFLAKGRQWERVRAIKLRGEKSFGLLVPYAPDLPIRHWNPPEPAETSEGTTVLQGFGPTIAKYDVENGRRWWRKHIPEGATVTVTEKIHGANARFVNHRGKFCIGSRGRWLYPEGDSVWHDVAKKYHQIEAWCEAYPECVLYGEVYGARVAGKGFNYDARDGVDFRAFDVLWPTVKFLPFRHAVKHLMRYAIPTVPVIAHEAFDEKVVDELSDGYSMLGGNIREGVVVEVDQPGGGVTKLKWVGATYLAKS